MMFLRCAIVFATVLPVVVFGQQTQPRTVYISIVDKAGAPIAGLRPEDVQVTEDGKARPVSTVSTATEPLTVAVIVDDGGTASPQVRETLETFVQSLDASTELGVFSAARPESTVVDFTRDRVALSAGLQRLVPMTGAVPTTLMSTNSGGPRFDLLIQQLGVAFDKQKINRPAIVVVTVDYSMQRFAHPLETDETRGKYSSGGVAGSTSPNWERAVQQLQRSRVTLLAVSPRHLPDTLLTGTAGRAPERVF